MPDITFGEYPRIFPNALKYRDFFEKDKTIEECIEKSEFIIIVNPNNPSGRIHKTEKIIQWTIKYPDKYFLVDESFIDYSNEDSILKNIEKEPKSNVIILKSLSKAHGIPGIRLGFIYTDNKDILQKVSQEIPIWNLNSFAEYYMEIALKFRNELTNSFQKAKDDRCYLIKFLKQVGFISEVYDSSGSFVTFRVDDPKLSNKLHSYLIKKHNIFIKQLSNVGLEESNYFRVALVSRKKIDKLTNALEDFATQN